MAVLRREQVSQLLEPQLRLGVENKSRGLVSKLWGIPLKFNMHWLE